MLADAVRAAGRQPSELLAPLPGYGEDQVAQLVAGLGAGLDRAGRATRSARAGLCQPGAALRQPDAALHRMAGAAATASAASDLPRRRRACRSGRITPATPDAEAVSWVR